MPLTALLPEPGNFTFMRAGLMGAKACRPSTRQFSLSVGRVRVRLLGVSTGAWIEGDEKRTRDCIAAWRELPDYASVNLSEQDAPAVIALLHSKGIGVEAGLATVADAERFVALAECRRALRILIEIEEPDLARGEAVANGIAKVLDEAEVRRPILLHGSDATVWHFVRRARKMRWSTRVGLEDGSQLPNGETAAGNAALVSEAVRLWARN